MLGEPLTWEGAAVWALLGAVVCAAVDRYRHARWRKWVRGQKERNGRLV